MSEQYILRALDSDPFSTKFEDTEGRLAFSVIEVAQNPNLVVKVTREPQWSQQHPDIMGPNNSFLYFGPKRSVGYLVYGNSPTQPMANSIRQKKGIPNFRHFTAQRGKELRWQIGDERMECFNGSTVVAIWEQTPSDKKYSAKLTIQHSGLQIVTEVFTTLILNRMAGVLQW